MTTIAICEVCRGEAALETIVGDRTEWERCPSPNCPHVAAIEDRWQATTLDRALTDSLLRSLGRCETCAFEYARCTCTLPSSDPYWLAQ